MRRTPSQGTGVNNKVKNEHVEFSCNVTCMRVVELHEIRILKRNYVRYSAYKIMKYKKITTINICAQ